MKWNIGKHHVMLLSFIISFITYSSAKTISSINSFYCYTDYSLADKPTNYLPKNSRIFDITCGCQHDWKKTFCDGVKRYAKMSVRQSPHVCICRQINDKDNTCDQFMTRCFADKRTKFQSCSCCFNQPDDHCNQLDCKNLEPDFGRGSNTSCICHDQSNYPRGICDNEDISPRKKLRPLYSATGKPYQGITDGTSHTNTEKEKSEDSAVYKTILKAVRTNKIVLAGIIVLVIGVFAAIIFGCIVICFGRRQSNRRTNTRREKRTVNEKRLLETTQNDIEGYLP